MPVKNHVPVLKEVIAEVDRAHKTVSDFSNSKAIPTVCVPDSSVTSSDLVEVVVMGEDTVTLNRGLMGKQVEKKSGFKGLEIGFTVGCGNVHGNRNTSKGWPKRSSYQGKSGSQSLPNPKEVESVEESTIGSRTTMKNWKRLTTKPQILNKSSIVDVELGFKRKQTGNLNRKVRILREKRNKKLWRMSKVLCQPWD